MAHLAFILFPGAATWRLAVVRDDQAIFESVSIAGLSSPADIASQVSETLRKFRYAGERALIAVPSSWCYAALISTADLPHHDRKAMLFRLEEKLPLPAESVVADFADSGTDG